MLIAHHQMYVTPPCSHAMMTGLVFSNPIGLNSKICYLLYANDGHDVIFACCGLDELIFSKSESFGITRAYRTT
jgi:hypothetical protein